MDESLHLSLAPSTAMLFEDGGDAAKSRCGSRIDCRHRHPPGAASVKGCVKGSVLEREVEESVLER